MRYLVTSTNFLPFLTHWFDAENNFSEGMTVYNLIVKTYTTDGINWKDIKHDHL